VKEATKYEHTTAYLPARVVQASSVEERVSAFPTLRQTYNKRRKSPDTEKEGDTPSPALQIRPHSTDFSSYFFLPPKALHSLAPSPSPNMAPASQEPEPASATTTRPDSDSSVDNIAQVCTNSPYLRFLGPRQSKGAAGGSCLCRTSASSFQPASAPSSWVLGHRGLSLSLSLSSSVLRLAPPQLLNSAPTPRSAPLPGAPAPLRPIRRYSVTLADSLRVPIHRNWSGLDPPLCCGL